MPADPVSAFDGALAAGVRDLIDTMAAVGAIGLTGPHVGLMRRIVVVRREPAAPARIYVNPAILWVSPERATHEEGSVSMPGMRSGIERPASIRIAFQDVDGAVREEGFSDFDAAILQHEIDQLDGIFWIDRLSRLKRSRLVKRFGKDERAPPSASTAQTIDNQP